jgi:AcrR family transcriptional regulator
MRITDLPPAKNSAPRERLLDAAARIFYAEGINTVGVARIVEEAGVTLATFYRHFPSKQDLILAYLQRVHDDFATRAAAAPQIPATCSG